MRSFAEIIQDPIWSFGGPQLCEVAQPKKESENENLSET